MVYVGLATAVAVQSAVAGSSGGSKIPKLNDALVRKASLKMQRWREMIARRKSGGFGSVTRPGQ
jgi:hypothetical protein